MWRGATGSTAAFRIASRHPDRIPGVLPLFCLPVVSPLLKGRLGDKGGFTITGALPGDEEDGPGIH